MDAMLVKFPGKDRASPRFKSLKSATFEKQWGSSSDKSIDIAFKDNFLKKHHWIVDTWQSKNVTYMYIWLPSIDVWTVWGKESLEWPRNPILEPCADVIVSAAPPRSILVGGGSPKKSAAAAVAQKIWFKDSRTNFVLFSNIFWWPSLV